MEVPAETPDEVPQGISEEPLDLVDGQSSQYKAATAGTTAAARSATGEGDSRPGPVESSLDASAVKEKPPATSTDLTSVVPAEGVLAHKAAPDGSGKETTEEAPAAEPVRRGEGWAPIKAEFIRPRAADRERANGDGSKGGGGQHDRRRGRGRNNKRPTDERPGQGKVLCPHLSVGGDCVFGDSCRFNHDVKTYLENKEPDLAPACPVWDARGSCPSGLKCRFGWSHIDRNTCKPITRDGAPDPASFEAINDFTRELQTKLRRGQIRYACDRRGFKAFLDSLDNDFKPTGLPTPGIIPGATASSGATDGNTNGTTDGTAVGNTDGTANGATDGATASEIASSSSPSPNPCGEKASTETNADLTTESTAASKRPADVGPATSPDRDADKDLALSLSAKRPRVEDTSCAADKAGTGEMSVGGAVADQKTESAAKALTADGSQACSRAPRGGEASSREPTDVGRKDDEGVANGGGGATVNGSGVATVNGTVGAASRGEAGEAANGNVGGSSDDLEGDAVSCKATVMKGSNSAEAWVRSCLDGVERRASRTVDFEGKVYVAPLTTVGNLPFRRVMKRLGADITCGEMALGHQVLKGHGSEWALLRRHPSEDVFGVQIAGAHPDQMARVAQLLEENIKTDFVDINLGCPIDIVCDKGMGAALMNRGRKLKGIIAGLTSQLTCPLTVKMRIGWDEKKPNADARYSKLADWGYVRKVAASQDPALKPVRVIGNGDILSWRDHEERLEQSKADNVENFSTCCMLARGALMKPWLPTEIKEKREWDISAPERLDIYRDFVNYGLEHWGSDQLGVNKTRRFLLEWLSFTHRYIPVGILEVLPQRINERPLPYFGRNDLEGLLGSQNAEDWIKISEMLLGPVPADFQFEPKHKANSYAPQAVI